MTPDEKARALNELIELFDRTFEPEQYKIAYEKSKVYIAENPEDSNAHFLLGTACYGLWYTELDVKKEAERAFKECLRLGPTEWDYQMTIYHLGFVYFLQARYQEALDLLADRKPEFFTSIDQFWRVAKLDEVELACNYYLQPQELSITAVEKVIQRYSYFDQEVCDAPLLIEISLCLNHLLKNESAAGPRLDVICAKVIQLIHHLDQAEILKKRNGPFFHRL